MRKALQTFEIAYFSLAQAQVEELEKNGSKQIGQDVVRRGKSFWAEMTWIETHCWTALKRRLRDLVKGNLEVWFGFQS